MPLMAASSFASTSLLLAVLQRHAPHGRLFLRVDEPLLCPVQQFLLGCHELFVESNRIRLLPLSILEVVLESPKHLLEDVQNLPGPRLVLHLEGGLAIEF